MKVLPEILRKLSKNITLSIIFFNNMSRNNRLFKYLCLQLNCYTTSNKITFFIIFYDSNSSKGCQRL